MKQLNNKNTVLIALAFLVIVAGVLVVRTNFPSFPRKNQDTISDTSSWQVFETPADKDYYYQIKYPRNWSKEIYQDTSFYLHKVTFYSKEKSFIFVSVEEINTDVAVETVINNDKNYLTEIVESNIIVDGVEGVAIEAKEKGNSYIKRGTPTRVVYLQKGNILYTISGDFFEETTGTIFDAMLNSFKVT